MADVMEACSNTPGLEVITDAAAIRSSSSPRPGTPLCSRHATHTHVVKRGNGVRDGGGEDRAGERVEVAADPDPTYLIHARVS